MSDCLPAAEELILCQIKIFAFSPWKKKSVQQSHSCENSLIVFVISYIKMSFNILTIKMKYVNI